MEGSVDAEGLAGKAGGLAWPKDPKPIALWEPTILVIFGHVPLCMSACVYVSVYVCLHLSMCIFISILG